jgi:hypothetical protein
VCVAVCVCRPGEGAERQGCSTKGPKARRLSGGDRAKARARYGLDVARPARMCMCPRRWRQSRTQARASAGLRLTYTAVRSRQGDGGERKRRWRARLGEGGTGDGKARMDRGLVQCLGSAKAQPWTPIRAHGARLASQARDAVRRQNDAMARPKGLRVKARAARRRQQTEPRQGRGCCGVNTRRLLHGKAGVAMLCTCRRVTCARHWFPRLAAARRIEQQGTEATGERRQASSPAGSRAWCLVPRRVGVGGSGAVQCCAGASV